jgi:hypothetical protein
MAQQTATTASVKISKNARSSGSKTQKFICECGNEIKMIQQFSKGKLRMLGRCVGTEKEPGCGQEGRSPRTMKRKVEVMEITRTI